jgi:hypothetical protein
MAKEKKFKVGDVVIHKISKEEMVVLWFNWNKTLHCRRVIKRLIPNTYYTNYFFDITYVTEDFEEYELEKPNNPGSKEPTTTYWRSP